jgi:hypothetical protein
VTTRQRRKRRAGPSPTPIPPLARVLGYKNPEVVSKFRSQFSVSEEHALELFQDMKRWLWLCACSAAVPRAPAMRVFDPIVMMDEMWHTFILFTKDYEKFCLRFFGYYIHHAPSAPMEKHARTARPGNAKAAQARERASLKRMYSFMYDCLGQEVLTRWYKDYPVRYSLSEIDRLRLPMSDDHVRGIR